jgi:hypothetical protein
MEDECGELIDMEKRKLESIRVEMTKYQVRVFAMAFSKKIYKK